MFLKEFEEKGYNLQELKPYEDFLIECSKKDYSGQGTHKHHILPKFMGGLNNNENLVQLSIEDHYTAHLILANCYDRGTDEYHYNLTSCGKIFGSAKRMLKKCGIEYNDHTFWKIVNIQMKDLSKGENNHMFGKTHNKEVREKISATHKGKKLPDWRKKQISEKNRGSGNPMFGKKRVVSNETRDKISIKSKESAERRFPLPEGVFKCEIIINGHQKKYFRTCPNEGCDNKIYSSTKEGINKGFRNKSKCSVCASKGKIVSEDTRRKLRISKLGKKIGPTNADRSSSNNSNAKTILNPKTGLIYYTMKSLADDLEISIDKLRKEIKLGKYIYLGKTNVKCIK